jgi:hypothetical protein
MLPDRFQDEALCELEAISEANWTNEAKPVETGQGEQGSGRESWSTRPNGSDNRGKTGGQTGHVAPCSRC